MYEMKRTLDEINGKLTLKKKDQLTQRQQQKLPKIKHKEKNILMKKHQ